MSVSDYVVLRLKGAKSILGGETRADDGAPPTSERLTLGASEAAEISREPDVLGAARSMPVALIQPFETDAEAAGTESPWGLEAIGALASSRTGAGVTVAVLDTGIDRDHEAFAGKTIVEKDFTGEGNGDGNGHGTHCAGTVFGGEIGGLRVGVAQGVERALIGKVLDTFGSGSTDGILNGLLWAAEQGANVISMSLGMDFPGMVKRLTDQGMAVEQATSIALEAYRQNLRLFDSVAALIRSRSGMFSRTLVIAASGNESNRPELELMTAPPAAADGFLAVGALGRASGSSSAALDVARFSNSGPDVSAPGVDIISAKSGGGLRTLSGTSMATPHVAGAAALWMEDIMTDNPNFRVSELEAMLVGRARKDVFAVDVKPADRGAGLVQSPR